MLFYETVEGQFCVFAGSRALCENVCIKVLSHYFGVALVASGYLVAAEFL